jgi:tRNA-2-methylthio-N6-dimethylallyladenosine synthase
MVAVMRGCDNFCSYCIVPFVRGRERSREPRQVLSEVRGLALQGVREVTLVGQNVNSYRWGDTGFPELLRMAASSDGIRRVRFITSHPKDLGPGLLEAMGSDPRICRHLHLPLQSGSDRVLALMNRGYTAAQFLDKAALARATVPGLALTTDVIAGFPGETEEEFLETLEAMAAAGFDEAFTYKYSPRPGTAAEKLPGQLPEAVRQERLERLIALQRRMALASKRAEVGRVAEVMVEGLSRKGGGQWFGRTGSNKPVAFSAAGAMVPGDLVEVMIEGATDSTLTGRALV